MSNEGNNDCSAKCPKCGNPVKVNITHGFPDYNKIKKMVVYCPISSCGYEDKWIWDEKLNYLKKQPEPPKTTTKIFKIEYTNSDPSFPHDVDRLDGQKIHEILKENVRSCIGIEIEEFSPSYWEITKIPEKDSIALFNETMDKKYREEIPDPREKPERPKKQCHGCGLMKLTVYHKGTQYCEECYNGLMEFEEPEVVKTCENCGWHSNNSICVGCDENYLGWKPIENSDNEITTKKRPFFDWDRNPEKKEKKETE